jgi:hypothetical protein
MDEIGGQRRRAVSFVGVVGGHSAFTHEGPDESGDRQQGRKGAAAENMQLRMNRKTEKR